MIDWSLQEVIVIVQDYFKMLELELQNLAYSKSEHRRAVMPLLSNRSEGSVEFKHQNISAVLRNMGLPYIRGYKPRDNYQELLEQEVAVYIKSNRQRLEILFEAFAINAGNNLIVLPKNFYDVLDEEPVHSDQKEAEPQFRPIKINYLEKEQNNRTLGEKGEEFVVECEKIRLIKAGKEKLAEKIEWISKDKGDGTGFDILSKNEDGSDRYIEVKTTKLRKETPIYLTKNEVAFASIQNKRFYLYRVFNFNQNPRFFIKNGKYESFCELKAQTFKGYF